MKLRITVEGQVYEVEVEVSDPERPGPGYYPPLSANLPATSRPPGDAPPPPPPPSPSGSAGTEAPVGDEGKVCRSPLAGAVSTVDVEVGQEIAEGDRLMVLEAMKMETVVTAPFDGTVKAVNAEVGDAVDQGQVLIEIE